MQDLIGSVQTKALLKLIVLSQIIWSCWKHFKELYVEYSTAIREQCVCMHKMKHYHPNSSRMFWMVLSAHGMDGMGRCTSTPHNNSTFISYAFNTLMPVANKCSGSMPYIVFFNGIFLTDLCQMHSSDWNTRISEISPQILLTVLPLECRSLADMESDNLPYAHFVFW